MQAFKRILFPVDFSARCRQTACFVAQLARSFEAELFLLHVLDRVDALELGVAGRGCDSDAYEQLIQHRLFELGEFAENCLAGLTVHRCVKEANPAECITAFACEHKNDLIALPTHGYGRFRRMLAGSVTLKVLHDAACPVLTTAHAEAVEKNAPRKVRNILCAVDLCPETVHVLRMAGELASSLGATARVVHVVPAAQPDLVIKFDDSLERTLLEQADQRLRELQAEAGTSFEAQARGGSIPEVLHWLAIKTDADLVMIGRGHVKRRMGGFWSHTGAIIHHVPCSVLSV